MFKTVVVTIGFLFLLPTARSLANSQLLTLPQRLAPGLLGGVSGVDDRTAFTRRTVLGRTVGQVRQHNGRRYETNCTGTLVGVRLVLTAKHCVALSGNQLSRSVGTYFLPSVVDGRMPRGTQPVKAINVWTGNTATDSFGGDWAILLLEREPSSNEFASFGYAGVKSPRSSGYYNNLVAVGYSRDFMQGETAGKAMNCSLLTYIPSSHGFMHDCDCDHGASGGPIFAPFSDGQLYIVGVMVAGIENDKATILSILLNRKIPISNVGAAADSFIPTIHSLRRQYPY